jgi:amino acid transporter
VHPKLKMPLHALLLICFVNLLLSLIAIGSAVAYNAIISLAALGIMFSYIIPILFLLLKKINGSSINYGPFRLGRWGIPVNIFALTFILFAVIWTPWPSLLPITAQSMNYAAPVLVVIIIGALADWFIGGRKRFEIPVTGHVPTFRE